jgi:hypothetical protein
MIRNLQGVSALTAAAIAIAAGVAFYFLIIGVAELPAAIGSLAAFWVLAVLVWRRTDQESPSRGPKK